ncbi:MAG: HAMP domain-containing histidine kinase [Lewinellaceae bacterium]|nr:HAMP domain-containing histidine kinase [Lewinellaceae bacterium]
MKIKYVISGTILIALVLSAIVLANFIKKGEVIRRLADADYRYKYFTEKNTKLHDQMVYEMKEIIKLQDSVSLQQKAFSYPMGDNSFRLFVDRYPVDTLGNVIDSLSIIWISSTEDYIGDTNLEAGGQDFVDAFRVLRRSIPADSIVHGRYSVGKNEERDRFGIFYKDSKRRLLFGLVVHDAFLREAFQQESKALISGAIALPVVFGIMFLTIGLLFLNLTRQQRKSEKANIEIRKQAAKLTEFEAIINSSHTAIAVMDSDSTITWTNKTYDEWYGGGYKGRKLLEESSYKSIDSVIRKCLKEGVAKYRNSGSRNGPFITSSITLSKYGDGDNAKIIFVASNITEILSIYEAVGHDLKSTFTAPRSDADLLIRYYDKLNDHERKNLTMSIHSGIIASESMALSLVRWAKYKGRNSGGERVTFKLYDRFKDMLENIYQPTFQHAGVTVHLIGNVNPAIHADRGAFEAVFRNLISNALKAMEESSRKELTISISEKNDKAVIKITDTGCGIPLHRQSNFLEEKNTFQGSGLYIAKRFSMELGGDFFVELSSPETGTTITTILPKI